MNLARIFISLTFLCFLNRGISQSLKTIPQGVKNNLSTSQNTTPTVEEINAAYRQIPDSLNGLETRTSSKPSDGCAMNGQNTTYRIPTPLSLIPIPMR